MRNFKSLISKWDPVIICLQETMMSSVEGKDLEPFWPHKEVKTVHQAASGLSRGILCCWDVNMFELGNFESMKSSLEITLKDIKQGFSFHIFTVYGPHSSLEKIKLLNKLSSLNLITLDNPTLFIWNFNCTRSSLKRKSCHSNSGDSAKFNLWFKQSNLSDIQISSWKFTWIGCSGKRSRLDRSMINA